MDGPLSAGEHVATLNGIPIRYRVAGSGPVLLVQAPGWGPAAAIYESTLKPLERDLTLVYYDPRGSGASGAPASAADLHVAAFADDLEALREHLGLESFALAGHSHGGLIAFHYALRHPQRVRALVSLCAQLVGVPHHPDERNGAPDPSSSAELGAAYELVEARGGLGFLFEAETDAAITAALRSIVPLYFRDVRFAGPLKALVTGRELPRRTMIAVSATDAGFPIREGIERLSMPVLLVSGRDDLFCPPGPARTLAEALPNARRVVFEESGHFPWLEERERFFDVVRGFLLQPTIAARAA